MGAVTITTPATERGLTTVAAVATRLGLTTIPEYLDHMVLAASAAIEQWCGTIFAYQAYQETLNGSDTDTLVLRYAPIDGTPTVTADGSVIVDFSVGDAERGFLYRDVGWRKGAWIGWNDDIELDRMDGRYPMFVVDYNAGYKLPGEKDPTLPRNIEEAAILTVVAWYQRDKRGADVRSKKVGDLAITYGGDGADGMIEALPAQARYILPKRIIV